MPKISNSDLSWVVDTEQTWELAAGCVPLPQLRYRISNKIYKFNDHLRIWRAPTCTWDLKNIL